MMWNPRPLPLSAPFADSELYIESLLRFSTSSEIFQTLCGGVHILDFLTREPDLYSTILPQDWREWLDLHDVSNILDFLMHADLDHIQQCHSSNECDSKFTADNDVNKYADARWQKHPPPSSLLDYVQAIRKHLLDRTFKPCASNSVTNSANQYISLSRNVSVGMKPKKIHEVQNFAKHIDRLSLDIAVANSHNITHFVDFGSGQNYLGRALASPPFNKNIVAIESKSHNIDGAKGMDVTARLAKREIIMRNKKRFRQRVASQILGQTVSRENPIPSADINNPYSSGAIQPSNNIASHSESGQSIRYFEYEIQDGDLSAVVCSLPKDAQLMVISLHSCGNLLHHGVRSLLLNPSVKAVAMVGCCYNLVTERLGPPTHKLSNMRSSNLRLDRTSSACDPHGFPMSERLATFKSGGGEGVRFNITARMMAVQAPQNWTAADCESFFTRHFYRALLQRIFVDRGVLGTPTTTELNDTCGSPSGWTGAGEPILIGSLRKSCYRSFIAYVRGAVEKVTDDSADGGKVAVCMKDITDDEIVKYEEDYRHKKKELSIAWSLMAFSAGVVESIIVVDRWLYLKEQGEVADCWVEAVFDYRQSPRNLVVVGIKK